MFLIFIKCVETRANKNKRDFNSYQGVAKNTLKEKI